MYCGCDNTWRDNIRDLLAGKLKYYKMTVNKWITYKCNCGCNTFYCYRDWFVCSECFKEHLVGDFAITFKTKEDAKKISMATVGTVKTNLTSPCQVLNTWHRYGIISEYEFDEFMKDCHESDALNCTNPEQEVYW